MDIPQNTRTRRMNGAHHLRQRLGIRQRAIGLDKNLDVYKRQAPYKPVEKRNALCPAQSKINAVKMQFGNKSSAT